MYPDFPTHNLTSTLAVISLLFLGAQSSAQTVPGLSDISLPDGFSIEVWADEVPNARSLALGESGTVFVSTRRDGRVYAVVQSDDEAPVVTTITEGLRMPNGIAFKDGALFVAENHRIIRFDNIETNLDSVPDPVVVIDTLLLFFDNYRMIGGTVRLGTLR